MFKTFVVLVLMEIGSGQCILFETEDVNVLNIFGYDLINLLSMKCCLLFEILT